MDAITMDGLARKLTTAAPRRRVLAGLGAVALGGLGFVAAREGASAGCHQRCRRKCQNRDNPNVCYNDCRDRLCR